MCGPRSPRSVKLSLAGCPFRQPMLLATRHVLDKFGAAEAKRGPVFMDLGHADGLKSLLAYYVPTIVAIDLRFVFLGAAFWISEPDDGVAFGLLGDGGRKRVDLRLRGNEREGKRNLFRL